MVDLCLKKASILFIDEAIIAYAFGFILLHGILDI